MTHRDPEHPPWRRVTLTRTGPPLPLPWWRRRKVRDAFWILALGSSACGCIGATIAAADGTWTSPWVVALIAWYVLVWQIIAGFYAAGER